MILRAFYLMHDDDDTGMFSVEELLSSYNVHGLLVEPANNNDLERLFANSQAGSSDNAGSSLTMAGLSVH